jgi:hypothetical protein
VPSRRLRITTTLPLYGTASIISVDSSACALISLQYSEIENANHHAMVMIGEEMSVLGFSASTATADNNVPTTQSATVLSQSARRSDFNQKWRTNSQYPDAPIAEPVSKIERTPKWFRRKKSEKGAQKMEPHNPKMGVAALQTVASMMKHSAMIGRPTVRSHAVKQRYTLREGRPSVRIGKNQS